MSVAESAAPAATPGAAAASKAAAEHGHAHVHGDGDGHGHSHGGGGGDHGHAHAHGDGHGHARDAHAHEHDHSAYGHGHSHGAGDSCSDGAGSKSVVSPKGADAYAVDAAQADAWCTDAWKGECKGLDAAVGRVVTGFVSDAGRGRQALLYFATGSSGSGSGSGAEKPYRLVPLSSLVPAPAPSTLVQLEQSPLFYAAANGQSAAVSTLLSHHASGNTGFGTTAGKHVVYAAKPVAGGFEVDMHSHQQPQTQTAAAGASSASASDASSSGKAAPARPNSRLVSAADIARANGFADAAALLDRHQQCRMCSGGGDCTLM